MSKELVSVDAIQTMANAVAKSGLFGIKTADQAMALMLIAQAEGLHPAIAARDYHVISGRPALKADAMLARFQAAGGKVEWKTYTDTAVSAVISHPQGGKVEIEWTIDMAKRAGLTRNQTWTQYPRQMLRARVISEGIRTVFPGVAVGVYTPEEVSDFDPPKDITPKQEVIEADVVEIKPTPRTASPQPKKGKTTAGEWAANQTTTIRAMSDVRALDGWLDENHKTLVALDHKDPELFATLQGVIDEVRGALSNFGIAAE